MRANTVAVSITLLLLAACQHGLRTRDFVPAPGSPPEGSEISIDIGFDAQGTPVYRRERSVRGSLLAVDDSALLVRSAYGLVRIPWEMAEQVRFQGVSGAPTFRQRRVDPPDLRASRRQEFVARAAQFARYPHGVSPDLLKSLLQAYGQDSLRTGPLPQAAAPSHHKLIPPAGPGDGAALAAFLAEVEQGTRRFADRIVAIREGYRRLGPDFPGMGQHWIHPARIVSGTIDPARPPVLAYAVIEEVPTLVAVAYTLPLAPGHAPPSFFGVATAWHDHDRSVDEEGLFLNHVASHQASAEGPRLAMVHGWMAENPEGVLAQNNWSLPFLRLGLAPPAAASVPAGRALSLVTAEPSYYRDLMEVAGQLTEADRRVVAAALRKHSEQVDAWVQRARRGESEGTEALVEIWRSFWQDVEEGVRPEAWSGLSRLKEG